MKKLKNKVFYTIFLILTISVLSIIIIFNSQKYLEQKDSINNSLNVASETGKKNNEPVPPNKPNNEPKREDIKFMDYDIYTILLDDNNNIIEIINHSNNEIKLSEISNIAKELLDSNKIKEKHIGLLYTSKYSYKYNENSSLIILDNTNINNKLLTSLYEFLIIFIMLEIIIYFLSKSITSWIIKPIKETFDKQKEFIADASHELKTPLSVIVSSSEALENNPKEKKWITNIKTEADRMNELITDLLELASSENKSTYTFENKNLSKIVELQTLTFEGKAYENNIKIKTNIQDNINMKLCEKSIRELVEILLDNAIKHSYKNTTININLYEENNNIVFEVKNKGDEIPKSEENKIFERFYKIDKSRTRNTNHYGLGLAIAKNIVTIHNGTIGAFSKNKITTFKVLFKK